MTLNHSKSIKTSTVHFFFGMANTYMTLNHSKSIKTSTVHFFFGMANTVGIYIYIQQFKLIYII